jgi:SAM-dependent methyltransferase
MARPRLLDLFCGAGGAAMGYHRAGFDVTGVDIKPQPRYPFTFVQADAMTYPLDGFDAYHASPVCLGYANVTAWRGDPAAHPQQLAPVIERLAATGRPAVIENVPEALATWDEILCGSNFGLPVRRHRGFRRVGWSAFGLLHPCQHRGLLSFMHKGERAYADAMGCTWMSKTEARQAIPPAYTEYIGGQLMSEFPAQEPAGRGSGGRAVGG